MGDKRSSVKSLAKRYLNRERLVTSSIIVKIGTIINQVPKQSIFIVGTGRSGSTLLVRILGSHSEMVGFPGEANELWHPKLYPDEKAEIQIPPVEVDPQNFTEVSIDSWPPGHTNKIRHTFSGYYAIWGKGRILVLKSAMISFMIPKILDIFPDARFIHIYRSGPSVIESYFKKNFGKYSRFSCSEEEYRLICARYWNACIMEIERVKESLLLQSERAMFELSYEELCDRPEITLDQLVRYFNLRDGYFDFDISKIESRNYKVDDCAHDDKWQDCLQTMEPAMRLMGYL